MARCGTHTEARACSGKCTGKACSSPAAVWVLAGCDGMISLFEKSAGGHLSLLRQDGGAVASSLEAFRDFLEEAAQKHRFSQMVLVGEPGDISWMQMALPPAAARHIAAEIAYPLMPAWFRQGSELSQLSRALEHLFAA